MHHFSPYNRNTSPNLEFFLTSSSAASHRHTLYKILLYSPRHVYVIPGRHGSRPLVLSVVVAWPASPSPPSSLLASSSSLKALLESRAPPRLPESESAVSKQFYFILDYAYVCFCVWACAYVCRCPEKGIRSSKAGVTDFWKLSGMAAGIWSSRRSSKCSTAQNLHLQKNFY